MDPYPTNCSGTSSLEDCTQVCQSGTFDEALMKDPKRARFGKIVNLCSQETISSAEGTHFTWESNEKQVYQRL